MQGSNYERSQLKEATHGMLCEGQQKIRGPVHPENLRKVQESPIKQSMYTTAQGIHTIVLYILYKVLYIQPQMITKEAYVENEENQQHEENM